MSTSLFSLLETDQFCNLELCSRISYIEWWHIFNLALDFEQLSGFDKANFLGSKVNLNILPDSA